MQPADIQLELPVSAPSARPAVTEAEVDRLIRFLSDKGWILARDIERLEPGWNDRTLRALAEASNGHILSSNLGYRLTFQATPPEFHGCVRRWTSQRDKTTRRIAKTNRVFHGARVPKCLLP